MKFFRFLKVLCITCAFIFILTFTTSCALPLFSILNLLAAPAAQSNNSTVEYDDEGNPEKVTEYINGKIRKIDYLEDGICTKREYYSDDEVLIYECTYEEGIFQKSFFNSDGNIVRIERSFASSIEEYGLKRISNQENYENGNIQCFAEFDETGEYYVKFTQYREDGTVEQVREYNEFGLIKYSVYDDKGELAEWSEYSYDENGKVIDIVNHTVD
ncbi:MAG: hypothetical protein IJA52_02425 [Clostridia bacterium]|nr:hypothetical protein [Clostridia bacterium]